MTTRTAQEEVAGVPAWTLGDRLRKSREHAGLTQGALADLVHAKDSTISGWERDQHRPSRLALIRWSEVCDVPLWWLTGAESDKDEGVLTARESQVAWLTLPELCAA